jgi:hypothetical protein
MSWLVTCIRKLLDHFVEVGFEGAVLQASVFFKLGFGVRLGDFGGDFSSVLGNWEAVCIFFHFC